MAPVYAPAYAKVNLSLDVCGRREDGYHLLKTVMQEISLKDDLWAEPWDEIKICCQKAGLPLDKNNIIYKVAKAFFAHTGLRDQGIKFTLDKQIPSGAGLGGGSADGVAALRLLDQLFATRLTEEEMVRIVAPIGADLPFFVYGGTALCEGIGERV
ncbi:MAG: 4-(cytidine 5'-diphospho)-2-C-methyl-D-erythritol kinase, partial [Clostridia bacterium]|nr:4-(cytidine 5'-diphospho)-2-C-methyl-D-erythritol kinase [Clostridia bacterium]